ncbi:sugar ABC transporter substrate-binding protein [Caldicellulosiruptor morganii]|uniref:Maltodextrin-binding protein n=1 Tax=Caldicellulosiruptor morganii TaxID=1387555 RepID=A0ABY7BPH7_9FIRM|nr:maltose ABC transporter substrate-binding protein [Caldicellulosiruptor morganii]WAM33675.1 maltose ABC transporter substrate-binding protein [Caldicellulosiruptor morganii]
MKSFKKFMVIGLVLVFSLVVLLPFGSGFATSKKQLVVWSHLTQNEVKALQPLADEWGKKNGYTVKVISDQGSFQSFQTAAMSGKGPDIMFGIPHDNLGTFWKAKLLEPVPANLIDRKNFVAMSLDACSFDGKLYALPIAMETYALFYNTSKVKEAPKTMSQLITLAKKYGFMYDVNNFYFSFAFIAQNGGYVFKNKGGALDPNDIGLANNGAIKGLSLIRDFVLTYKFMPKDIRGDIAKGNFQNGKIAFYISGPWDVGDFVKAKVPFAVAPLPKTDDGKPTPSFVGVQSAFVSAKSKNKDAAFKLLKYLVEESQVKVLFKVGSRIPVTTGALSNPEVKADKIMSAFAEQAKVGIPMPNIPEMQAVWGPAGNTLSLVTTGKATPKQAAEAMVKQIKQGIAQMQ